MVFLKKWNSDFDNNKAWHLGVVWIKSISVQKKKKRFLDKSSILSPSSTCPRLPSDVAAQ